MTVSSTGTHEGALGCTGQDCAHHTYFPLGFGPGVGGLTQAGARFHPVSNNQRSGWASSLKRSPCARGKISLCYGSEPRPSNPSILPLLQRAPAGLLQQEASLVEKSRCAFKQTDSCRRQGEKQRLAQFYDLLVWLLLYNDLLIWLLKFNDLLFGPLYFPGKRPVAGERLAKAISTKNPGQGGVFK